jgi:hypothetical protein
MSNLKENWQSDMEKDRPKPKNISHLLQNNHPEYIVIWFQMLDNQQVNYEQVKQFT